MKNKNGHETDLETSPGPLGTTNFEEIYNFGDFSITLDDEYKKRTPQKVKTAAEKRREREIEIAKKRAMHKQIYETAAAVRSRPNKDRREY